MHHATVDTLRTGSFQVLLQRANYLGLLSRGLVSSMSELGRCVDPFQFHLFVRTTARVHKHGFAEGNDTLLYTRNTALDEKEVVLDLSVADKSAKTGLY